MDRLDQLCDTKNCSNLAHKFYCLGAEKVKACPLHLAGLPEDSFDIADTHLMESVDNALSRKGTRHEAAGTEDVVAASEEQVRERASLCAERALTECAEENYEEAAHWWKEAFSMLILRFPKDKQTVSACLELGWVLSQHLNKHLEAQKVIEQGLSIVKVLSPASETVKTEDWLEGVLVANTQCKDGEELLRKAVELGQDYYQDMSQVSAVMCFLGWTYLKKQDRLTETEALLDFYFSTDDSLASEGKALSCILLAEVYQLNGSSYLAEKKLTESLLISRSNSNSLAIAKTLSRLGDFYVEPMKLYEKAEEKYSAAVEIYAINSPASQVFAETLCKLGDLYIKNMERYAAGEEKYQAAINILAASSPIELADTLCRLAHLYIHNMDRYQVGEQKLKEAIAIYAVHSPTRMTETLVQLGEVYLQLMERYQDGDQAFQEAIERYGLIDSTSTDLADTLFKLGEISIVHRGLYIVGEQHLQAAMAIYATNGSVVAHANALCRLALVYSTHPMHKYAAAEQAYKKAIELYRLHDPTSKELINALCTLSYFYVQIKQDSDGEEQYIAAIAIQASKHPKSIRYAELLSSLGDLYSNMSRYEAAEQQYKQAIELYRAIDQTSTTLADLICKLGQLYYICMKQYKDGEAKLKEALAIHSAASPNSTLVAETLSALAEFYNGVKCYGQAEETYRAVIAMHTIIGPSSLALAKGLWRLGDCYAQTLKQHVDGEKFYRQALEIYAVNRPTSISFADSLTQLASYYELIDRFEASEHAYISAIEVHFANSTTSFRLSETLYQLGRFYMMRGRVAEGERKFQEATEVVTDPHSRSAPKLLSRLVYSCSSSSKTLEAIEKKLQAALAIHVLKCPTSIDTADLLKALGDLDIRYMKKFEDGVQMCQEAIEIYTANQAMYDVVQTLYNLGDSYFNNMNRPTEGTEKFKEAVRICRTSGLDSLVEVELLSDIARTYYYCTNQYEAAEQMHKDAIQIYAAKCSTSVALAAALSELSDLYMNKMSREADGELKFQETMDIYTAHSPTSIGVIETLCKLADMYYYPNEQRYEIAKKRCKNALLISTSNCFLQIDILSKLGHLCSLHFEDLTEAEQSYLEAIKIWTNSYPNSLALADLQCELAGLYSGYHLRRYEDAEQCYFSAIGIYNINHLHSGILATLVCKLGGLYTLHMNRYSDAENKFKAALMILAANNSPPCESFSPAMDLANLYVNHMRRHGDGEHKYIDVIVATLKDYKDDEWMHSMNLNYLRRIYSQRSVDKTEET